MTVEKQAIQEIAEDADDDVHVSPDYGPEHELSVLCWCGPTRDQETPKVVVHKDLS